MTTATTAIVLLYTLLLFVVAAGTTYFVQYESWVAQNSHVQDACRDEAETRCKQFPGGGMYIRAWTRMPHVFSCTVDVSGDSTWLLSSATTYTERYLSMMAYVSRVIPDVSVSLDVQVIQSSPLNWGLDRLDQLDAPLDSTFCWDDAAAGQSVPVYIIDTGVRATHQEFAPNRITSLANVVGDGIDTDCHGHGTHVASILAGNTVGVARRANRLFAVKAFGCSQDSTLSVIIDAVNIVTDHHSTTFGTSTRGLINMSFGLDTNAFFNEVVADLANSFSLWSVTSAGNTAEDACLFSPASATTGVTSVGAIRIDDQAASFSNTGTCVHVMAPGNDIVAAAHTADNAAVSMSGTSMAAPFVAGVLASLSSGQPSASFSSLVTQATVSGVLAVPSNLPNKLITLRPGVCTAAVPTTAIPATSSGPPGIVVTTTMTTTTAAAIEPTQPLVLIVPSSTAPLAVAAAAALFNYWCIIVII